MSLRPPPLKRMPLGPLKDIITPRGTKRTSREAYEVDIDVEDYIATSPIMATGEEASEYDKITLGLEPMDISD
jgi:hypothetical protein